MESQTETDFLLWCRECRRALAGTMADLDRFQAIGFPECCGEIMTMYTKAYFLRGEHPDGQSESVGACCPMPS
jgi:hypothetical protein